MYGLDLKLILTNALGFLLLVFVLRRLAWGNLLGAIDQRRDAIKKEIDAAQALRQEAETLRLTYDEKLKTIDAEARTRIQAAVADGQRIAAEIKEQTHQQVLAMRAQGQEQIRNDIATARLELRNEIVRLTMLATEKLIHESLDGEKQRKLVQDFLREIEGARA